MGKRGGAKRVCVCGVGGGRVINTSGRARDLSSGPLRGLHRFCVRTFTRNRLIRSQKSACEKFNSRVSRWAMRSMSRRSPPSVSSARPHAASTRYPHMESVSTGGLWVAPSGESRCWRHNIIIIMLLILFTPRCAHVAAFRLQATRWDNFSFLILNNSGDPSPSPCLSPSTPPPSSGWCGNCMLVLLAR